MFFYFLLSHPCTSSVVITYQNRLNSRAALAEEEQVDARIKHASPYDMIQHVSSQPGFLSCSGAADVRRIYIRGYTPRCPR